MLFNQNLKFNKKTPVHKNVKVPKQILPHLKALVNQNFLEAWVINFYHDYIKNRYENFIEQTLFGPNSDFEKFYLHNKINQKKIDKILLLKSFFTKENISLYNKDYLLKPLKSKISNDVYRDNFSWAWPLRNIEGDLNWYLQNELMKAIKNGQTKLTTIRFDSANRLLLEMIQVQILCYMKKEISLIEVSNDFELNESSIHDLNSWIERELNNRVPYYDSVHSKINHENKKRNAAKVPNQLLYLLNGTNRLGLFAIYEYLIIKEMIYNLWSRSHKFSKNNWKWNDLYFNLVIESFKFVFEIAFVLLIPYRLLRTFVNELTSTLFAFIRNFSTPYMPDSRNKKGLLFTIYYSSQIACYLTLLYALGLPLFPNPISWLPSQFFSNVYFIAGIHFIGVYSLGLIRRLNFYCGFYKTDLEDNVIELNKESERSNKKYYPYFYNKSSKIENKKFNSSKYWNCHKPSENTQTPKKVTKLKL